MIPAIAGAQDDGTTTNNWSSMTDYAPIEATWDYALSPGWYFFWGVGFAFFVGLTGVMAKIFLSVTDAGDAGGER